MTIKLNDLSRWYNLPGTGAIAFKADNRRLVRLMLNCEAETAFYIKWAGTPPRFLTTVPAGLETVEFYAEGSFEIAPAEADGPAVQWQTAETEPVAVETTGESFTSIHERQPRNEALEYVMFVQEQNAKRREESLRAEFAMQMQALRGENGEGKTGVHGVAAAEHKEPKQRAKAKQPADVAGPVQREAGEAGRKDPANGSAAGAGALDPEPVPVEDAE